MKTILLALSLSLAITEPAGASLITFDDMSDAGTGSAIPIGYAGFTWNNFRVLNTVAYLASAQAEGINASGYNAGTVSPQNVIYAAWSDPASISGLGKFDLTSAFLTAAWNDNLQVEVVGSSGGIVLYDQVYVLNATVPTLVTFNYAAVDLVQFSTSGGTQHYPIGMGTHFCMDNLTVNENGAIPEPATYFAGGLLLLPLGAPFLFGLVSRWGLRRNIRPSHS